MYVQGRSSSRHMKGKQVALTLYLPPRKYWLLKALSQQTDVSMQTLLRRALDEVLADTYRNAPNRPGAGVRAGIKPTVDPIEVKPAAFTREDWAKV